MSTVTLSKVLLLLTVLTIECLCTDLPLNFPVCNIDRQDIDGFLLNAAKQLKPQIIKGIKETGLPSFDTLTIPKYNLQVDRTVLQINASFANLTVNGFENHKFKQIGYVPETKSFYGSLEISLLEIEAGIISMQERVLFIIIEGAGHCYLTFGPLEASFKVDGEIIMKNGVDYSKLTSVKLDLSVKDGYYHLSGLFDNNTNLNYLTNMILNKNSEAIAYAAIPGLTKMGEEGLLWLMTSFANKVPYQQLFPHSKTMLNIL